MPLDHFHNRLPSLVVGVALGLGPACREPDILSVQIPASLQVRLLQGPGLDSPPVGTLDVQNCDGIGMSTAAHPRNETDTRIINSFDYIWDDGKPANPYEEKLTGQGVEWGRIDLILQYVHCGEPASAGTWTHYPFFVDDFLQSGWRLDHSEEISLGIDCFPPQGFWGEADPAPTEDTEDSALDSGDSSPWSVTGVTSGDVSRYTDCEVVRVDY